MLSAAAVYWSGCAALFWLLTPTATMSAGKLIWGFTLRTLGQLPTLWTVEACPSLPCLWPVVIRR